MPITITDADVAAASAAFYTHLAAGHKQEAIATIEALTLKYMTEYQADPDAGSDFFYGNTAAPLLQDLIAKARKTCPLECEASSNELLRFKLGDRVYGFNIDEAPILFALQHAVPPGRVIIDHVNDHFRDSVASPISAQETNRFGTPIWLDLKEADDAARAFEEFYLQVPKLKDLPRQKIDDEYDKAHGAGTGAAAINRGCKAGILKTVLEGGTVHFNLDYYMNAAHAEAASAKRDKNLPPTARFEGFFTVKEQRFIKRLCDTYPSLADKIKFYNKGQEVPPPWNQPSLQAGWENYHRKTVGGGGIEATMGAIAASTTLPGSITATARQALDAAKVAAVSSAATAAKPLGTP